MDEEQYTALGKLVEADNMKDMEQELNDALDESLRAEEAEQRAAFHERVFLAVLPVMISDCWDSGLAAKNALIYADEAVRQYRGPKEQP